MTESNYVFATYYSTQLINLLFYNAMKLSIAIKWNATSVLLNQWENRWKMMFKSEDGVYCICNIYTALFPSKGALTYLSTNHSLNQHILENEQQTCNNRNRIIETLNYFIEKNNTSAWRFPFFYLINAPSISFLSQA